MLFRSIFQPFVFQPSSNFLYLIQGSSAGTRNSLLLVSGVNTGFSFSRITISCLAIAIQRSAIAWSIFSSSIIFRMLIKKILTWFCSTGHSNMYCLNSESSPKTIDRKSTRLNSSHALISYAVFCLKKKKKPKFQT